MEAELNVKKVIDITKCEDFHGNPIGPMRVWLSYI